MGPDKDKSRAPTNRLKLNVWAVLTHLRAIKEETMAINRDRVYNQTCRLPHGIHVMSNFFITSDLKVFELITRIRVSFAPVFSLIYC